jgi:carbonic anhydrase
MNTGYRVRFSATLGSLALLLASSLLFAGEHAPHWDYEGEEGPEHWGEISDLYRMCSEGMNQSPIDITVDVHAGLPELVFDYHSSPLREINNGHTIQQNIEPGSFLTITGRDVRYELKQFHFHSPSEHEIDGKSFAMEMHFVHTSAEGALAQAIGIEETNLLPPTREYFAYSGSLTTPPCSEGVAWIVLKDPIEASAEQIARFKERVGPATNRPVQPRNARLILD